LLKVVASASRTIRLPANAEDSYNGSLIDTGGKLSKTRRKGFAVLILAAGWWSAILNTLVIILGFLLIFLILIQRGKGGGLAGAFGGAGGSSAFGSRAGDMFTRITIILAAVWILLIMVQVKVVQGSKTATQETTFPTSQ
jgi:preprotein translocase subunit SecG